MKDQAIPHDSRTPLIQCVPNFSEGRDLATIESIVHGAASVAGSRVVDWSADTDHHRFVLTLIGTVEGVRNAALAAAEIAINSIDLRKHKGVHPRLGALDVLPLVPLKNITLDECAILAVQVGEELARRHSVPVFFYEAASPYKLSLPEVRRRAFVDLAPDAGPTDAHASAGAMVVGARTALIAYNVILETSMPAAARQIAHEVRESSDWPGVRALGLRLHSQNQTQVSMNITRPDDISLWSLYSWIGTRATELGTRVVGSEVIGALPGRSAFQLISDSIQSPLKPGQVLLETWPDD